MKRLSIIVPCYNVEKYIDRCLKSLTGQTLAQDAYEIILVDDASTDTTWQHITAWEAKYPELILAVHCDENGKMGRARNIGLSYATGEYVGFADSDDWVEPEMFEALLSEAEENRQDVVICRHIRDRGNDFQKLADKGTGKIYRAVIDTEEKRRQLIVENTMSYAVWDKVIRRSLLTENEIVFPEGLAYEDIYFGSLLQLYAKRIAKMDRIYYHYFVNQKSTVLSRETGYHKDIMMVNQLVLQTYQERGMWERYHDELELDLLFTWYLATVKVICLRFDKPPYDMFCRLKEDILANMPGCVNNKYIKTSMREFHQLLMQLLTCYVTPSVLCRIAEQYRQYLQIDQKKCLTLFVYTFCRYKQ